MKHDKQRKKDVDFIIKYFSSFDLQPQNAKKKVHETPFAKFNHIHKHVFHHHLPNYN